MTYALTKSQRRSGGKVHDLNLPPPPPPLPLNMLQQSPVEYQSVCTLERVKSALERWHRPESPASSSTTTSSLKRRLSDDVEGDSTSSMSSEMVAAGCPSCLLYVLISSTKPKCPRCNSEVPLPLPVNSKKQRIDLNALNASSVVATNSVPLRTVKFF